MEIKRNYKGELLEFCTKHSKESPIFTFEETIVGKAPLFKGIIKFQGQKFESEGRRSKKEAEQEAAQKAFKYVEDNLFPSNTEKKSENESSLAKNVLQEYCIRNKKQVNNEMPQYDSNWVGGPPHHPQYKSVVVIGDAKFESRSSFSTKKEAELDAALAALEGLKISEPNEESDVPESHEGSKNSLQEFCQKRSLALPEYKTTKSGIDHVPTFESSVTVGSESFQSVGKHFSKKSAEQSAASIALQSLKTPNKPKIPTPSTDSTKNSSPKVTVPEGFSNQPVTRAPLDVDISKAVDDVVKSDQKD